MSVSYHYCDQCGTADNEHMDRCYHESHKDEPGGFVNHWPPLCCPGCGCQSFEEEHNLPENIGMLDGAYY